LARIATRLCARPLVLAFIFAVVAAVNGPAPAQTPDFGTAPSGVVPIIFNDHHVYAKPDTLRRGRVLAALVKGTEIFVPLRSMFEQMGATVSYDPATKKIDVSKAGESLQLTVGKAELIINGESKPLDVPPEIYRGVIVVPVRVISEGMGAYVQWLPDRRIVVVRYVAAAVPPPPPPTASPAPPAATAAPTAPPAVAPPPTPSPAPVKKARSAQAFVVGDYLFSPKVANEFDPGNAGKEGASYAGRAGLEIPVSALAVLVEADARQYQYPHNASGNPGCIPKLSSCCPGDPGCVTTIGDYGQTYVPAFTARDSDLDGRIGFGIPIAHLFLDASYLRRWSNYGYPTQTGVGFGIEKVPDLKAGVSIFGSLFYYPSVTGNYTDFAPSPYQGQTWNLAYKIYRYQAGATLGLGASPIFLEAGFLGDRGLGNIYAPSDFTHSSFQGGLGLHF
jgi:hypothetical protein